MRDPSSADMVVRTSPNRGLVGVPGGANDLETPALVVDLEALRANIAFITQMCVGAGIRLRPHAKTHKCSAIAKEQIRQGAAGVCCATPRELIAACRCELTGLLLTVPVVQRSHFKEISALHLAGHDIMVVIDDLAAIDLWETLIGSCPRRLPALVDLDLGMGRTGVRSSEEALAIARRLARSKSLCCQGVQAYSGHVQHIGSYAERRSTYMQEIRHLEQVLGALRQAGLPATIVSGGGTGSFAIDLEHKLFNEVQVGSYIFMDAEYRHVEMFEDRDSPYLDALFLRATIIGPDRGGYVVTNAGFKSLSTTGAAAEPVNNPNNSWKHGFFGDEYGKLSTSEGHGLPESGEAIDLLTPHCDPTVSMHDFLHVIHDGVLVEIWNVDLK